ncbi:MAG: heavy metal-binding domain-containing protein [Polyangiaceae bacterium]
MNARFTAVWTMLACFALGCSPGPVPISQSPHDPSNPSAPEGVVPRLGSEAPRSNGPASPSAASDAGSASAVFACPMHPDVTASQPGRCPKCGMNLAARK